MGDVGDYWREHREYRRSQGLSNSRPKPRAQKVHFKKKHERMGFRFLTDWHWQVTLKQGLLDFWPSKSKWRYAGVTSVGTDEELFALVKREAT